MKSEKKGIKKQAYKTLENFSPSKKKQSVIKKNRNEVLNNF